MTPVIRHERDATAVPETIPTSEAAASVGVSVQHFLRLMKARQVEPVVRGAGIRGPMFWAVDDVAALAEERAA